MGEYFANIWRGISTAVHGMAIVLGHLMRKKVTRQYPDPKDAYILPERARNRLYVNMDDCIGCDKCARACPVNCITIDTVKAVPGEDLGMTSNGKKKALWVTKFDIDMAQCCYCSLCVWPCPTECIVMTEVFEFSEFKRENLIYHYATMDKAEAAVHEENWSAWEAEAAKQRARQAAERAARASAETQRDAGQPQGGQPQGGQPDGAASSSAAPAKPGVLPPPFAAKPGAIKPPPFRAGGNPPQQNASASGEGDAA